MVAIELSNKKIELETLDLKRQINFIGRLERNERATMFLSLKSWKKHSLNFHKMLQQLFDFDCV